MSSPCPDARCLRGTALLAAALLFVTAAKANELRVCADPDNLPYSHEDGRGFENRIAALLAEELGITLRQAWMPLRRGFVRKTLGAGLCDVLMGVPADAERMLTTLPYYRSSYVFVTRADEPRPLQGFDDPRLTQLRVGVQLPGDDLAATPPGHALVSRGAIVNVRGYPLEGETSSAERMLADIAAGQLDAALVWGAQAGWFARQAQPPLRVTIAEPPAGLPLPFAFAIAIGVSRDRPELRERLDAALVKRRAEIDRILDEHGVPRTDAPEVVQP